MKKLLLLLPLLSACNDNHHNAPQYVQPPQAYSQEQYAPQQYAQQPQYAPQQYAQQQPVIIQQESSSGVGSFVAGAAAGALAGHVYNKMNESDTHAPSYNRSYTDYNKSTNPAPVTKSGGMDMAKLSESAKQQFNTSPAPAVKSGGMDMSRLSHTSSSSISRPSAPIRSSGMNMSRLSSSGRR